MFLCLRAEMSARRRGVPFLLRSFVTSTLAHAVPKYWVSMKENRASGQNVLKWPFRVLSSHSFDVLEQYNQCTGRPGNPGRSGWSCRPKICTAFCTEHKLMSPLEMFLPMFHTRYWHEAKLYHPAPPPSPPRVPNVPLRWIPAPSEPSGPSD